MNKKGFAVSIILYSIVFIIVTILYMLLGIVKTRYEVTLKEREIEIPLKDPAVITCQNKVYNGTTQTIATCSGGTIENADQRDVGDYLVSCVGDANHDDATSKTCSIEEKESGRCCFLPINSSKISGGRYIIEDSDKYMCYEEISSSNWYDYEGGEKGCACNDCISGGVYYVSVADAYHCVGDNSATTCIPNVNCYCPNGTEEYAYGGEPGRATYKTPRMNNCNSVDYEGILIPQTKGRYVIKLMEWVCDDARCASTACGINK